MGLECNFTLTFFIDFGLTNYQRARLARRLCEVATYRMSGIKDLARVRAMQEWKRVQKQVSDIREQRVASYASLTDFLERGLAASVADVARFAGRYENLRNRVRDHLSRMRTELSVRHMADIVDLLNSSRSLASTSEELLRGVGTQATQQTRFLRNADLLVVIGAIYYTRSLLEKVLERYGYQAGTGWPAVFRELAIVAGLAVIVLVTKRYADLVLAAVARGFRRIYGRIDGPS